MQNKDVAHKFFYDLNGHFDRSSMTVSYYQGKYYSYATCIGEVTETIDGETVCLISDNNFSMTTAKHLNELVAACPFRRIRLPQYQGSSYFYPADVVKHCIDNIEYYSKQKLSQKNNRERFSAYYRMLQNTLELKNFESQFKKSIKILDEYKELYNSINDPEKLKELKARQKEAEKIKQQKLKEELENIISNRTLDDLAYRAYDDYSSLNSELKAKLRKYLNPKNELSFIWFDGEFCRTSQHITVNRKEVEVLLKLWQKGKLKHGMKISYYTVLEVMPNYVKVGCHKIPVENLQALCDRIVKTEKEVA